MQQGGRSRAHTGVAAGFEARREHVHARLDPEALVPQPARVDGRVASPARHVHGRDGLEHVLEGEHALLITTEKAQLDWWERHEGGNDKCLIDVRQSTRGPRSLSKEKRGGPNLELGGPDDSLKVSLHGGAHADPLDRRGEVLGLRRLNLRQGSGVRGQAFQFIDGTTWVRGWLKLPRWSA
jgi:hypothetical protein